MKDAAPGGGGDGGATGAGGGSQGSASSTAADARVKAKEASHQALTVARENPIPVAVGGSLVVGYLLGRAVSR